MATLSKRLIFLALLGLASVALAQPTVAGPRRLPPTRAASSIIKIGGVEYVPTSDLAHRFGLRAIWLKQDERLLLKNDRWQIELGVDSRDSQINNYRLLLGEPCRLQRRSLYLSRVDAEQVITAILRPGYGQASVPDLKIIAIDPGHGGVDNGTQNNRLGLKEKNLAMDVAVRLGKILRAQGYKVVLTRDTDIKVELALRAAAANAAGADLFISLHFNSLFPETKTTGTEIFTFAPPTIRSTDAWGGKTNDAEKDPSPANKFDHWNSVLGYAMQSEMLSALKTFDRGKKFAHWGVLRALNCPGVLVESGFLSNDAEARKLATPEYRQQIAEAIARGIRAYGALLEPLRKK